MRPVFVVLLAHLLFPPAAARVRADPATRDARPAAPDATAVEALRRLKGLDLEAHPAVKAAVLRVLEAARGTPVFLELVRDFRIPGQNRGLIEVAVNDPESPAAPEAVLWVVRSGGADVLREAWSSSDDAAREALVRSLARSGETIGVPMLVDMLKDPRATPAARTQAVRGLALTERGAGELLRLAGAGELEEPDRWTASLLLAQSRWPEVREHAREILPPPTTGDGTVLPSLAEWMEMTGDPVRGRAVFRDDRAACLQCHRVDGEGRDFGPDLTTIGAKLGREALLEAVLNPSAGIAFGYEGWNVERLDGEEVFGILVSETSDELGIRLATGAVVRVPLAQVARRTRQALSLMPAGLAEALTRQELADLMAYLETLRGDPQAR